jgi:hypothetical protein
MNRTLKCVKFELARLLPSTGIFIGIYCFFYLLAIILYFGSSGFHSDSSSNMNFCFAAAIFAPIVLMVLYKNFTNNLVMFSNARQSVLNSIFISSGLLSAGFAVLSLLSDCLNTAIGGLLGFHAEKFLTMAYGQTNPAEQLLFFFTLLLTMCTFGLFYGVMEYKIGRVFRLIFWFAFVLIWMVIPIIQRFNAIEAILKAVNWYFGLNRANGILHMSLHFFITALLFAGIVELIARRQPQND